MKKKINIKSVRTSVQHQVIRTTHTHKKKQLHTHTHDLLKISFGARNICQLVERTETEGKRRDNTVQYISKVKGLLILDKYLIEKIKTKRSE